MVISNPEAEAALIYSLILDPTQILDVVDLTEDDFVASEWSRAYREIRLLVESNQPVDILTLREKGVTIDRMELAGNHAPATEYARLLREASYRRRVVTAANAIASAAESDESTLIETVEHALGVVRNRQVSGTDSGMLDLAEHRMVPPPPHLGILAPSGTTVIYGEGGDGKGWIAASMIRGLLRHGIKSAILDFENHPSEWAYRLDRLGVSLDQVAYFQPGGPMGKWADSKVATVLREKGVQFLVIDSAMYASNTDDPYSPQGAMQYKQARLRLGNLPALLLAHTAKGGTSIYGSVFWRNEARITWYLSRDSQGKRSLICKKTNAYPALEGKELMVDFDEVQGMLNFHEVGKPFTSYIHEPEQKEEGFTW